MISDEVRNKIDLAYLDVVLLSLVTLSHPTWDEPLRYVRSQQDITCQGILYKAKEFSLPLPAQTKKDISDITLMVVDIDRELTRKLMGLTNRLPGSATFGVITAENPDVYEIKPMDLEFTQPTITNKTVTLNLGLATALREIFPAHKYRPATYPGLF